MKRIVLVLCAACTTQDANVGNTQPPPPTPTPAPAFGSTRWALAFGGIGDESGIAIAMDSNENVIVGGELTSPTDFGSGPIGNDNPAAWVTKRAAGDGQEVWTHVYGTEPNAAAEIQAVTVAPDDSVFVVLVVGTTSVGTATVDLGGTSVTTTTGNSFLMKLDPGGHLQWARGFGEGSGVWANSVAFGPEGNIYVSGTFMGTLASPITATLPATEQVGGFVAAFTMDGTPLWGHVLTGAVPAMPAYAALGSTAVVGDGDVLVTGSFYGMVTFGGDAIASNDDVGVLARFSPTGELRSRTQLVADFSPGPAAFAPDGSLRAVSLPTPQDVSTPQVVALTDDGATMWISPPPTNHIVNIGGLALTDAGTAIVAGATNYADLTSNTTVDQMYLAAYDSTGAFADLRTYDAGAPNTNRQTVTGVASRHNAIAFTGQFDKDGADFGTGPVPAHGYLDAVIAVIDPP